MPKEAKEAYEKLKLALCSRPILAYPDPSAPFELYVDASEKGFGAALVQRDDQGRPHAISYASRQLKEHVGVAVRVEKLHFSAIRAVSGHLSG